MTNPVFHGPLANPISPERMHREIHAERHADCTPQTCDMLSSCRNILTTLGHDPDAATTAQCPACRNAPLRNTSRAAPSDKERRMTPSLPQRIPRTSSAPAIQGDPLRYAAIAQALRTTPAASFPCLNDLIPRRPPTHTRTDTAQPCPRTIRANLRRNA